MRSFSLAAAAALVLVVLSAGWSAKPAAAQEKPPAAQAKSSPEALRIYTDAANFQNNGAFDLGAEEWEKFVQRFPQDPLVGKAQYYAGVCRLQLQQHDKAIAHFEAAVANFPKFELAEDARFNLAAAQYGLAGLESTPAEKRQELYNSAAAAYGALIEQFPQGKYLDRALFWRGEALYRLDKKAEAIQAYARVVQEHPKSSLRPDALYVLGVTQEELANVDERFRDPNVNAVVGSPPEGAARYLEAGKTYDTFLAEFANHELAAEVRMRKAETLLQTGKLAEAEKQFAEVAALENFAQADHAVSRQALAIARQDRFVDAANLYATIPTRWPQSPYVDEARIEAARAFYRGEQLDQAATWLQKVIDSKSKFASEAAHWLSRIYLRQGEPQKAAELAGAAIPAAKNDPYLPALKMDQAEGLLESGAKEEALTRFTSIAQEHANTEHAAPALYNAAFAAMSLGRHDQSLKTAQDFLAKFPNDRLAPDVKYIAAESHLQLRNPTEAATLFAELASSAGDHPDLPLWRLRWANTLYLQKKYQETIDTLTPLLKTFEKPNDAAEAQFLIGASRFYLNQPAEAAQALAASVEAAPMGPRAEEALLVLSRAYRSENKLDEAKAAVSRLLQTFPQGALRDQAFYRLGEYLYAAGQHTDAVKAYDAVMTNHAQSVFAPYALYGKGWALLQAKQFAPASETLTKLLEQHPQHELRAEALFARAMSRRQTGDQQGAIDDITAYLAAGGTQEHRLEALYERGLAELALNQPAVAAATFESILKEKPDYLAADKALYQLAWAHKTAGDNDKALAYFARLAQEHPNSPLAPEAHFHLGEKQYDDENYADAAKSYATAKQKAARGDLKERVIYKLGWANYQQKIYQAALAEFNEQLTAFPQGALAGEAQFMKAESLFKMGDYSNALPAYDAALQKPLADETAKSLVLLHAGQAAGQLKQWEVSLRHLESLIETYPESPYLAEAIYERGFARQNQGQLDAAMADYLQAAEASRGSVGARARFMRGELFFTQKNYDEAVKEFQRVMFGFGGEQSPEDVKPWQAKSGYEAARCRDVQIQTAKTAAEKTKAIEEARRYYSYVVERHPTNDLTPAAKKRLEELQKL